MIQAHIIANHNRFLCVICDKRRTLINLCNNWNGRRISSKMHISRRLTSNYIQISIRGSILLSHAFFKGCVVLAGIFCAIALHYRTTNIWTLKNMADVLLSRWDPLRLIVIGAFHRVNTEQNVPGNYVVLQFLADVSRSYQLYCFSTTSTGKFLISQAHIQRIHQGKRFANDICSMAGHIAECQNTWNRTLEIEVEKIVDKKRHKLVVCMAPAYQLMEWRILLLSIETWLALGATKIIVPIQTISKEAFNILHQYEQADIVVLRHWPKWPILTDKNPNGLVLSRGIEESHVNCLFFAKPWAEMVAFSDFDDILIPEQPLNVHPNINVEILQNISREHPQAGSFLFEHRDVQLVLPDNQSGQLLENFRFNFLNDTTWKKECTLWRMKTRVIVNASRVDTVNMHESGINRFGYVQVRVPCHQAHFYHMRHSFRELSTGRNINMKNLYFHHSFTETLKKFDECVIEINKEHFKLKVSRCMTPHVCYLQLSSNVDCIASVGIYHFTYLSGNFILAIVNAHFAMSDANCDAPMSKITAGNYFYAP
ncbi:unnamed protein product [Thelazia callipaeda]|uniref:Glycosyltransferase family 92 protein n=1 Tax=Thelazia callipaeda TaxID=103827 RepID=A0A158RD21_THECL|nr:unnamed protein product [Thelazia callipaeda]